MTAWARRALNSSLDLAGAVVGVPLRAGIRRGWLHFPHVSQALSILPFSAGWKLRRAVYARLLPQVGRDVVLHFGVTIEDERSRFGDDVWVSTGCYLDYVEIGSHVLVGPGAILLSGGAQHRSDRLDVPIKLQGNPAKEPLIVEDGAWIGAGAVVMAAIGHDAIVGAGAVVTRPVPPSAVAVGNPARVIRSRVGTEATTPVLPS